MSLFAKITQLLSGHWPLRFYRVVPLSSASSVRRGHLFRVLVRGSLIISLFNADMAPHVSVRSFPPAFSTRIPAGLADISGAGSYLIAGQVSARMSLVSGAVPEKIKSAHSVIVTFARTRQWRGRRGRKGMHRLSHNFPSARSHAGWRRSIECRTRSLACLICVILSLSIEAVPDETVRLSPGRYLRYYGFAEIRTGFDREPRELLAEFILFISVCSLLFMKIFVNDSGFNN